MSKTRMGKRVASLLLSLVMMLSLLPTTVYATGGTGETNGANVEATNTFDEGGTTSDPEAASEDEGGGAANLSEGETATAATIGSATYETLDEAIAAVTDGETIVVNAGEYKLNGSLNYTGKAFTIAAAEGADVSFDMSAAVALHGAKITFNNVTFNYKTNGNYIGLQHADTLVYNNCTINGMVFLYAGNETFNGCTFNQTSPGAYNVWTYGAQNVAFNGCTFNCAGKAVLVYNEGANHKTDLTVENTKFNASAPAEGKAAIEIDTSLMEGGATITVDNTTATGFANGSNSGNALWNDKKQTADTNKNTTVTVAGETVFAPKATVVKPVSVNGTSYETLEDAIDAATPDANGVITYEISGKVDVTATGWVQVAKAGLTGLTAVKFVGTTDDAAIYVTKEDAVLADQVYGNVDVSFSGLTLVKENPTYLNDYAEFTQYFAMEIRATVKTGVVTYTDCKFPEGVINNTYGKTVFTGCEFSNDDSRYNLWVKEGEVELNNGAFTGTRGVKLYNTGNAKATITIKDTTFDGLTGKAAIVVSQPAPADVTLKNVTARNCTVGLIQKDTATDATIIKANGESISGTFNITNAGNAKNEFNISAGTFTSEVSNDYCADGFEVKANADGTYGVVEAATAAGDGTEANPYTLEQLGAMTRSEYVAAQERLNGTMYVTVGNYAYGTNGVLGNGVRNDTPGQTPDHSKLNAYGENGYLGEKNDGANGKSVVFVGGSITSGVTGYTSIDEIGTSLLLALPAYTNVTFKGTTFKNVMSFNYQLYTSPWSQLGELKFDGCTFNGIIVGAIAAQKLTFNKCVFENYTNTTDANSSNPTWIRPAYGNWTQGDNEGQGSDFRSLTTINFTGNKVTSTRPVKFEFISQWDITSTVTATGNSFDISKQDGDTTIKNVGLYLGAHTDANAFNLVAEGNTKSANTAALYTIPEGKTSLPLGSTVKNLAGKPVELTDALKWKAGDAEADKIVLKSVPLDTSVPAGYVEDEQGNVTISDEAGLFWFAKQANAGNNFAGKTVTLANDIALTKAWTPIGIYKDSKTHFKGTFDGQNHTVSGVEVTENGTKGVGFFGKVYTGTIKNLTVEGTITATNCDYVGGIVGHGYATISNCTFKGNVGSTKNTMQVGGIAGSGGFTITNCSVYGNVTAECWAGGIVGNCQDGGAYTNCYVEGVISAGRSYWGGGAAGITPVPLYPSQVISSCYSNTVVKVAGEEVNCPIIAAYNNPLDYNGYTGDLKIYDNSWNKQKNGNDSYPIYAEKDGAGGVLVEGKDVSRDNNLVMLEDDLQYVTDLSKVRIMAGSAVTQAQVDALAVASIGTAKYITLAAAIAAAKDGETVMLLKDVTEDVTINKNITLDLGGKTLTNTGAGKATISVKDSAVVTVKNGFVMGGTKYYNIEVTKDSNANLTLMDVTATAGNTDSSMIDNWGTLTIESGTYEGGLNVVKSEEGSTLTINGGKFTGTHAQSSSYNGVILSAGTTTINDGEFIQSATTPRWCYPQVVLVMQVTGYTSLVTVNGGTFTNKYSSSGAKIFHPGTGATSDNLAVKGGTFNKEVPDSYCADGFIPTKNADGTYGVKAGKYVAQIGSKKYETLADAIRLAAKGKTITLLDNVTENVEIKANKDLTLDLNGFTLNGGTGTAKAALYNLGTITIQDTSAAKTGTIKRDDTGTVGETSYYVIRNQGTMTIESGIVINNSGYRKANSTGSMVGSSLICNGDCDEGGTLTIKGGTFTQNNFIAIKNGALGVLHVTGGTITSNHSAIQNWFKADITGGEIKGQLWTDAWKEGESVGETKIGGDAKFSGEIVMDITGSVAPTLEINGGNLNVTNWRITSAAANAGAKPAVSGGTFTSAVKEEYCATGYIPKDNGDGTYGVKEGVYVAKVDNVKYETLQAAIDAAKGGSTVRLLANVTLTETAVFPAGKTVHLNLVGHSITATGTALRINGTTDIQSTGSVGTIESTGNVAVAVGNNASLTVYSGTLKGREGAVITGTSTGAKIEIRGSKATLIATDNAVIAGNGSKRDGKPNTILVKGGTFIGGIVTEGYIACGIYAPWNDNVTVSGGTFNITNGAGIVARAGTVTVTGGTFSCTGTAEGYVGDSKNKVPCAALVFDKAANYPALTESSQILVSGGSFSTDPAANGAKLADGYVATPNADGVYKVAKANPVAAIGDVKYDTLQAAITAAQDTKDGATITLLKNINTESYYMVNGENPVTIDLAGHNITGSGISGLFYVTVKGDLTIKGEGTVTAVEDNKAAMAVWVRSSFAKVTLEGGTYTQQITNTADPHFDLIYVERGNVYVKGGTYKGFTPDWTLNCKDDYYQSKEANIEVTGGTFVGFDPANNKAEGENTNFVPAGYVSTKGADGNFVVTEVKVAEVNGVAYATLSEAIAAAKDGDIVTLLRDINTPEISYMISKSLTIDLNGMTVTGSGYDAVFQIDNADAKVVIKNGKVVAVEQSGSAGKYTMAIWASKAGCEVTLEGLDVSQKITHTEDPQMDMIYASGGTITINSGNFVSGTPAWTLNCNDTSYKNGTANIIVKGGTFVGFDPANNKAEGENTSFVAAGYVSNMNEDGSYTVVPADASIKVNKRLTIGNDLTMTYLVTLSNCTDARVKFQFYNDDIKGYTEVMVENGTKEADGRFAFDFTGINPQRMTDTLKATVYATDVSGGTIEYQVDDYSVAQYCINTLKKSTTTDSVKKLIGNLVAYGAAAQVYKNYREDNLVSSIVTGVESTDYVATELSKVTSYGNITKGTAGINIVSKTLVLSNTFAVRVYFTLDEGIDIGNVRFKVTANNKVNEVDSFQKDSKGRWYFDYAKLNATQLDSKVTFESFVVGTEGDTAGDTLEYSVNTYLAKMMPQCDKSSDLYKFMAELFNYGCACKEFE